MLGVAIAVRPYYGIFGVFFLFQLISNSSGWKDIFLRCLCNARQLVIVVGWPLSGISWFIHTHESTSRGRLFRYFNVVFIGIALPIHIKFAGFLTFCWTVHNTGLHTYCHFRSSPHFQTFGFKRPRNKIYCYVAFEFIDNHSAYF